MCRLALFFSLLIMSFISACDKADNLALADDEFLLTSTGERIKCSNYIYKFRTRDYARIKAFLTPEPVNVKPIGLVNLDSAYKADEQIVVKLRKLTADEVPFCTAEVIWYNKAWVLEHRALR